VSNAFLDPDPYAGGCRCAQCFGLREYLIAHGCAADGLPPAPGHPEPIKPAPVPPVLLTARRVAPQPWEPRPARSRASGRTAAVGAASGTLKSGVEQDNRPMGA
jgi:hypothetical protein